MKRREQPVQDIPPAKPLRMQSAGLYGEVGALPINRHIPMQVQEPKTFL